MNSFAHFARRFSAIVSVAFALAACGASSDDASSAGADLSANAAGPRLLALGDSIAYGWHPEWDQVQNGQPRNVANLQKATLGTGYPEKVAKNLGLAVDNASCPGEASGSFIDAAQVDNGCRQKRADGLKMTTPWGTAKTQLEFALGQVKGPNPPKVITISLGGNELFLLTHSCQNALLGSAVCIAAAATLGTSGAPATKYGENMQAILEALHSAGFTGTVVVVSTHAMDYGGFAEPIVIGAFNSALSRAVDGARASCPGMEIVLADAYEKFKELAGAKPEFSHNACNAGLLIDNNAGAPILDENGKRTCDRHPSQPGHQAISDTIVAALPR
jgi:lysophospholipase L1-like esterase